MACNNCLQEILEDEPFWEDETEGTVYHKNCRQAALDRRNKAEEERAAALARVAELEAQLAAQQWRPVTEKPEPDQEVEIVIEATFDDYGPGGWTSYGYYFAADYPTGWRPLPPAPQETE